MKAENHVMKLKQEINLLQVSREKGLTVFSFVKSHRCEFREETNCELGTVMFAYNPSIQQAEAKE